MWDRAVFLFVPSDQWGKKSLWTGKWAKKIILTPYHVGRCSFCYLAQVERTRGARNKNILRPQKVEQTERGREANRSPDFHSFARSWKGLIFFSSTKLSPRLVPITRDQNCFHLPPSLSAPFIAVFLLALSSHRQRGGVMENTSPPLTSSNDSCCRQKCMLRSIRQQALV